LGPRHYPTAPPGTRLEPPSRTTGPDPAQPPQPPTATGPLGLDSGTGHGHHDRSGVLGSQLGGHWRPDDWVIRGDRVVALATDPDQLSPKDGTRQNPQPNQFHPCTLSRFRAHRNPIAPTSALKMTLKTVACEPCGSGAFFRITSTEPAPQSLPDPGLDRGLDHGLFAQPRPTHNLTLL
jgi:hypothetical protein